MKAEIDKWNEMVDKQANDYLERLWAAPTTIALTRVGTVEISTGHLGSMDGTRGKAPYETCLFYDSDHMPSKVTGRYATEVEALRGHIAAIKKQLSEVKT